MSDDGVTGRGRWAPRVSRVLMGRLYRSDASGVRDEQLLDEVGMALYARVESILEVTEAHRGNIRCWGCGGYIQHRLHRRKGTVIRCEACGWNMAWEAFHRSYRKKQLVGGGMEPFLREFRERYPGARTYAAKMLLIDGLTHRFHCEATGSPGRSGAVNLIGGTAEEVVAFLDQMAYGERSTGGLAEAREAWRRKRQH